MSNDIKSCNIIYGYYENCLIAYKDSPIILIEPRKSIIDNINLSLFKNIILIKKLLVNTNKLSETILHYDRSLDNYWLEKDDLSIYGTNCFNTTKQLVYTTSLCNLINQYKIQNIENLVLNININNNNDILESLESFNHIISYIKIKNNFECKLFNNFDIVVLLISYKSLFL